MLASTKTGRSLRHISQKHCVPKGCGRDFQDLEGVARATISTLVIEIIDCVAVGAVSALPVSSKQGPE
jgi:hypothetical protein